VKYEIEIPEGTIPAGYEPVEFRVPKGGETVITYRGGQITHDNNFSPNGPRMILRKKWEWPEWLASKWICRDEKDWWASADQPEWDGEEWMASDYESLCMIDLKFLPDVPPGPDAIFKRPS